MLGVAIMILILLGDPHIRSSNPENRIDDYKKSLFNKLEFIFKDAYTIEHNVTVLIPGDIFDNPVQSNATLSEVVSLLKSLPIQYLQ